MVGFLFLIVILLIEFLVNIILFWFQFKLFFGTCIICNCGGITNLYIQWIYTMPIITHIYITYYKTCKVTRNRTPFCINKHLRLYVDHNHLISMCNFWKKFQYRKNKFNRLHVNSKLINWFILGLYRPHGFLQIYLRVAATRS